MRLSLNLIVVCTGLTALASLAHADIYRCVDAAGGTSYSDTPCPRDARSKSNITEDVGACTTTQCEEQRRQLADEARQRLRAEKEELSEFASKRKQAELDYERARLDELRYRKAVEDRLAVLADQAAQGVNNPYYDYPGYPSYPVIVRPCGRHCNPHPIVHPDVPKKPKERSVRGREIGDPLR